MVGREGDSTQDVWWFVSWAHSFARLHRTRPRAGGTGANTTATAFDVWANGFKVRLPAGLADGVYRLCVDGVPADGTASALCTVINAPDPWWRRGDVNLTHATAGGWVRVFGRLSDEHGRATVSKVVTPTPPVG